MPLKTTHSLWLHVSLGCWNVCVGEQTPIRWMIWCSTGEKTRSPWKRTKRFGCRSTNSWACRTSSVTRTSTAQVTHADTPENHSVQHAGRFLWYICRVYTVHRVNKKLKAQLMLTNMRDAFGGQSTSPNSTIPYVRYNFLLCNSNFVFTTHHFYDIRLQKCCDLEIGSKVTQGHWEWFHLIDGVWFPISVLW